jgi:ATP-dependent RNA helicase DeaD
MSESIKRLTSKYLNSPYEVSLNTSSEPIRVQSYAAIVYEEDKEDALTLLLKATPEFYGIIFAQTKKQVNELEIKFRAMGLQIDSLHGDKVQAERTRVINRMKKKELQILVATDVAARGLDIEDLTHVVNFEIPWDAETYTHRIGRTARAGKTGIVWTLVRPKEAHQLRKFERALKQEFKPLAIPSVSDVRKGQIRSWIKSLNDIVVPEKEQEFFNEITVDLQVEEEFLLSAAAREWLFKALYHSKIGADFEGQQPRSFELRPRDNSQGSRAHGDRPRHSGVVHSRRNSRSGFGERGGRDEWNRGERGDRSERFDRGGGDRGFRGEDRGFREDSRPPRRASGGEGGWGRPQGGDRPRPARRSFDGDQPRVERSASDRGGFRPQRMDREFPTEMAERKPRARSNKYPKADRSPRAEQD